MFKFLVLSALAVASASALTTFGKVHRPITVSRPVATYEHTQHVGPQIAILRQDQNISPEGSYQWAYETANGIAAQEAGEIHPLGPEQDDKKVQGSFSYTSPEGIPIQLSYNADGNGFQPAGAHLPVAPPIPEAILRSLAWNAAHPEQPERNLRVAVANPGFQVIKPIAHRLF